MNEEIPLEDNPEEVVPIVDTVDPSPENEIDLQPIIDILEDNQRIQVEFFNDISSVLLIIPLVIIACFAIKEFMDRATRW